MDLKSERPSFLIYKADYEAIKNLSDQNLGKLFRAIFEYHNDKELQLEPEVQMALNFLKKQLQLDHIKWEKKVAAQKANGEKGGRPKNPTKPMGFPKTQPNQKNLKKKKGKRKKKLIKILIWKIQEKLQSLESILQKAGNY